MRTLYDSVTPTDIPTTAAMVAGYVDGVPRWPASGWARFPTAVKVRIALNPATNDGHVLDIENGAANPDQAPGWVLRRRAAGVDPTCYMNASLWPTVRAAFRAAGVAEPHYWVAAYPGTVAGGYRDAQGNPTIPPGAIAHQYADPATSGGHWDLSVVADYWPGVDEGDDMSLLDEPIERAGRQPITLRQFLAAADDITDGTRQLVVANGINAPIERTGRDPITVAGHVAAADDITDGTRALITTGHDDLAAQNTALKAAVQALTTTSPVTADQVLAAVRDEVRSALSGARIDLATTT